MVDPQKRGLRRVRVAELSSRLTPTFNRLWAWLAGCFVSSALLISGGIRLLGHLGVLMMLVGVLALAAAFGFIWLYFEPDKYRTLVVRRSELETLYRDWGRAIRKLPRAMREDHYIQRYQHVQLLLALNDTDEELHKRCQNARQYKFPTR